MISTHILGEEIHTLIPPIKTFWAIGIGYLVPVLANGCDQYACFKRIETRTFIPPIKTFWMIQIILVLDT